MESHKSVKPEDLIKFVTGLSSAAVALIATFAVNSKIIPVEVVSGAKTFTAFALVSFVVSITAGVLFYVSSAFQNSLFAPFTERYTAEQMADRWCKLCSVGFLIGVYGLTYVAIMALAPVWVWPLSLVALLVYGARTKWRQWRRRLQPGS